MKQIVIEFQENDSGGTVVIWHSVGWGDNPTLMKKAKAAINKAKDPEEVFEFLNAAGFDVAVVF